MIKEVLGDMEERGRGQIAVYASIASWVGIRGNIAYSLRTWPGSHSCSNLWTRKGRQDGSQGDAGRLP